MTTTRSTQSLEGVASGHDRSLNRQRRLLIKELFGEVKKLIQIDNKSDVFVCVRAEQTVYIGGTKKLVENFLEQGIKERALEVNIHESSVRPLPRRLRSSSQSAVMIVATLRLSENDTFLRNSQTPNVPELGNDSQMGNDSEMDTDSNDFELLEEDPITDPDAAEC